MEKQLNYLHNASLLDDLAVGDLIEIPRVIYSHWAVYYGDGKVAHFAGGDNDGGKLNKAKFHIGDFWTVVAGCKANKNNGKDSKWSPHDPATIVKNISSQLGKVGYNLFNSNCEHFANWCRYGIYQSDQVDNALTAGIIVVASVGVATCINALTRYSSDNKNKK